MVASVIGNAIMQFIFAIVVLFYIGDYETVSASRLPIVEIYYGATKSKAAATALVVVMHGSIFTVSLLNIFASVSRLVWAFARDKGLPFHRFFTYVRYAQCTDAPTLKLTRSRSTQKSKSHSQH